MKIRLSNGFMKNSAVVCFCDKILTRKFEKYQRLNVAKWNREQIFVNLSDRDFAIGADDREESWRIPKEFQSHLVSPEFWYQATLAFMFALWVFSFLSLYFSVIYFCNNYPDHWIQQPIPKLPILNFHEFSNKSNCVFFQVLMFKVGHLAGEL